MIENYWQLQDAKNKFSKLVEKAQHQGPQVVTKHGKDAVVVLAVEEYQKLIKPRQNLVDFFKTSPLAKEELIFDRNKDLPRDIKL
jgi:prevent-host-death family protein